MPLEESAVLYGTFRITDDHVTLMQHINWRWNTMKEGGVMQDPSQPYGREYAPLYQGAAKVLGWPTDEDLTNSMRTQIDWYHETMPYVLEILMTLIEKGMTIWGGENIAGVYYRATPQDKWEWLGT